MLPFFFFFTVLDNINNNISELKKMHSSTAFLKNTLKNGVASLQWTVISSKPM